MKRIASVALMITMVFSGLFISSASAQDPFDYARGVYEYVQKNYYGEIDDDVLANNLVLAIAQTLDKYSVFMSPAEAGSFFDSISGEFVGIGVSFVYDNGAHRILTVMKRSPARTAGILPGDLIMFVDDIDVRLLTSEETATLVKGPEGVEVVLKISREGFEQLLEFRLIREKIIVDSSTFMLLNKDVGYIEISAFNQNTYKQVSNAVDHFKSRGINKIVLDLRNNGGGLVSQAVLATGIFIGQGDITKLDFFNPDHTDISYVSSQPKPDFKLSVLVNENTASAAELMAAAIMENDCGIIIGQITFGKGIFQTGHYIASYEDYIKGYSVFGVNVNSENAGGYLHMTTGRYLTPLGNDIHNTGITPDVNIKADGADISIKDIEPAGEYFNHHPGGEDNIRHNAKMILSMLGYDTSSERAMEASIVKFQESAGLIGTGTFNYITTRVLDHHVIEFLEQNDIQLAQALKHID